MRLYIVASPFQFFLACNDAFAFDEKSIIFVIRYKNDDIDYLSLSSRLFSRQFYVVVVDYPRLGPRAFSEIALYAILFLKIFFKVFWPNNICIGDHCNTPSLLVGSIFGRIAYVLGDGASIVWGHPDIQLSPIKSILFKILNIEIEKIQNTVDVKTFTRDWPLVASLYKNLPVKNEIWIFGSTAPMTSLEMGHGTNEKVRKGLIGWTPETKDSYWSILARFTSSFNDTLIKYFPHRNECIPENIPNKFAIVSESCPAEFRPILFGYLPTVIIGSSTIIFSFSNIRRILKRDIEIYFFSFSERIDMEYKRFGACPIPSMYNLVENIVDQTGIAIG